MYRVFFLVLIAAFSFSNFYAQRNLKDSTINTPWVAVHYGGHVPKADLKERFGYLNSIGFLAGYKTNKNWFYGAEGNFFFGEKINEKGVFNSLTDSYGTVTDINGDVGMILLHARGLQTNFSLGKIIPVFGSNNNSGLFIHVGAGYLLHKLRLETQEQVIPLIELDYKRGYDRLTHGVNFHQFIGYSQLSNNGFANFYAGFYAMQGLTKNFRDLFYDRPDEPVSKAIRTDLTIGFKVGWMVPIYKRMPKAYYFN